MEILISSQENILLFLFFLETAVSSGRNLGTNFINRNTCLCLFKIHRHKTVNYYRYSSGYKEQRQITDNP